MASLEQQPTLQEASANGDDAQGESSEHSDTGEVAVMFLGDVDMERDLDGLDDDEGFDADGNLDTTIRLGTTSSARFNILATMVGGGSLSLPLAFAKSGNVLTGPILLIVMAAISEYCFQIMVKSVRTLSYKNADLGANYIKVGRDSFESIAAAAFGPQAYVASMALVTAMCFFAMVAYGVLLRDILEPITVTIYGPRPPGPSWQNNSLLWVVVVLVTPLCTLRTLTSLKRYGAASMYSVLILGCCVLYRSFQCNVFLGPHNDNWQHWTDSFRLWPERWWDVLDVFPLYISCFVCHYNIPTVHNELRRPTVARVNWWLRSTTWAATFFYMAMGIAGSAYGAKCTATGHVQGNILLDFRNSDPLLSVGRACLAVTISIAFPMLTIPARDIVLRSLESYLTAHRTSATRRQPPPPLNDAVTEDDITEPRATTSLREPLLSTSNENGEESGRDEHEVSAVELAPVAAADTPWWMRLVVSIVLLWTGTAVASIVDSIDTVWDLLGSSLSIFLSFLIPAGSYLVIMHRHQQHSQRGAETLDDGVEQGETEDDDEEEEEEDSSAGLWFTRTVARTLIAIFIPLMFLSMGNAVYHTFFESNKSS